MTAGQIALGLLLVALAGLCAYVAARSPPKPPFGHYRESPMFRPKGRLGAMAIAIVFAAVMALLFFARWL